MAIKEYPVVWLQGAGCTGCSACLMVCPDFCFEVYQFDDPKDADRREASA